MGWWGAEHKIQEALLFLSLYYFQCKWSIAKRYGIKGMLEFLGCLWIFLKGHHCILSALAPGLFLPHPWPPLTQPRLNMIPPRGSEYNLKPKYKGFCAEHNLGGKELRTCVLCIFCLLPPVHHFPTDLHLQKLKLEDRIVKPIKMAAA